MTSQTNHVNQSSSRTTTVSITTTRKVDDVKDEQIFALGDIDLTFDDVTLDDIMSECDGSARVSDVSEENSTLKNLSGSLNFSSTTGDLEAGNLRRKQPRCKTLHRTSGK